MSENIFAQYLNKTEPIDKAQVEESLKSAPLYGKKIIFIGDSYIQNHQRPIEEAYHYKIARKYGMTYLNYGRNGNCIAFDRVERGFGVKMLDRLGELEDDADYVIVAGGHNDATMINLREDNVSDKEHEKDVKDRKKIFEKNLGLFISALKQKYPNAKIAFISPWEVDRPFFPYIKSTLKKYTKKNHIRFFEAGKEGGIRPNDAEFRAVYFQGPNDTAHLNNKGHDFFMPVAEKFLLSL